MTFAQFAELASRNGLDAVDRGHGHWQVRNGDLTVNYYPSARRGPTIYVNKTRHAFEIGDAGRVMQLAKGALPKGKAPKRHGQKWARRNRIRIWLRTPWCHWCKKKLKQEEATLEHIVPRARGGSDYPDNLAIACHDCNQERGHTLKGVCDESDRREGAGRAEAGGGQGGGRPAPK